MGLKNFLKKAGRYAVRAPGGIANQAYAHLKDDSLMDSLKRSGSNAAGIALGYGLVPGMDSAAAQYGLPIATSALGEYSANRDQQRNLKEYEEEQRRYLAEEQRLQATQNKEMDRRYAMGNLMSALGGSGAVSTAGLEYTNPIPKPEYVPKSSAMTNVLGSVNAGLKTGRDIAQFNSAQEQEKLRTRMLEMMAGEEAGRQRADATSGFSALQGGVGGGGSLNDIMAASQQASGQLSGRGGGAQLSQLGGRGASGINALPATRPSTPANLQNLQGLSNADFTGPSIFDPQPRGGNEDPFGLNALLRKPRSRSSFFDEAPSLDDARRVEQPDELANLSMSERAGFVRAMREKDAAQYEAAQKLEDRALAEEDRDTRRLSNMLTLQDKVLSIQERQQKLREQTMAPGVHQVQPLGFEELQDYSIAEALNFVSTNPKATRKDVRSHLATFFTNNNVVFEDKDLTRSMSTAMNKIRDVQEEMVQKRTGQFMDLFNQATDDAQTGGADLALNRFMTASKASGLELNEKEVDSVINTVTAFGDVVTLSATEKDKLSRILTVTNAIDRITDKLRTDDSGFGPLASLGPRFTKLFTTSTGNDELDGLLVEIGMSSDLAGRIRSGAALQEAEYARFTKEFAGGLESGADGLIARLQAMRDQFADEGRNIFKSNSVKRQGDSDRLFSPDRGRVNTGGSFNSLTGTSLYDSLMQGITGGSF